ncbi:hypothetical protein [Micromonospora psammae]|uniref:hypothetical protein n=1 Tax=Micromonospora sp. CPCC 205556 TaxID=3122398 RepID=UPI002FEFAFF0
MAFRTWGRLLLTALGVSVLAGAGQLGIAYGFGIVRLTGAFTDVNRWPAQLAWVGWFAVSAAVAGAVVTGRLARREGLPDGTGVQLAISGFAALGAVVVAPLCMQPARAAELSTLDPVWAVGICAVVGAVVGAGAASAVLLRPPLGWNVAMLTGVVWLIALVSAAPTLLSTGPLRTVRLGVLEPTWLDPDAAQRLAMLLLPALALLAGAVTGGLARWRGHAPLVGGAAGATGPVLLAFAYLTAGPGDSVDRYQLAPYYGAVIAVAAGALGSAAATLLRWPLVPRRATGDDALAPTDILAPLPAGPDVPAAAGGSRAGVDPTGATPADDAVATRTGPATPAHWDWPVAPGTPAPAPGPATTRESTAGPSRDVRPADPFDRLSPAGRHLSVVPPFPIVAGDPTRVTAAGDAPARLDDAAPARPAGTDDLPRVDLRPPTATAPEPAATPTVPDPATDVPAPGPASPVAAFPVAASTASAASPPEPTGRSATRIASTPSAASDADAAPPGPDTGTPSPDAATPSPDAALLGPDAAAPDAAAAATTIPGPAIPAPDPAPPADGTTAPDPTTQPDAPGRPADRGTAATSTTVADTTAADTTAASTTAASTTAADTTVADTTAADPADPAAQAGGAPDAVAEGGTPAAPAATTKAAATAPKPRPKRTRKPRSAGPDDPAGRAAGTPAEPAPAATDATNATPAAPPSPTAAPAQQAPPSGAAAPTPPPLFPEGSRPDAAVPAVLTPPPATAAGTPAAPEPPPAVEPAPRPRHRAPLPDLSSAGSWQAFTTSRATPAPDGEPPLPPAPREVPTPVNFRWDQPAPTDGGPEADATGAASRSPDGAEPASGKSRGRRGLFRRKGSRDGEPVAETPDESEPLAAQDEEFVDWVTGLSRPLADNEPETESARRSLRSSGRHHRD